LFPFSQGLINVNKITCCDTQSAYKWLILQHPVWALNPYTWQHNKWPSLNKCKSTLHIIFFIAGPYKKADTLAPIWFILSDPDYWN
jgi:hypothetical protein